MFLYLKIKYSIVALTGCRRNQNPSCFSLEGFGKPWIQSRRVGGGASEQPCWFQEVGRRRRWGRAVDWRFRCIWSQSMTGKTKLISEDLQTNSSHQEQQPLQSLIDWPPCPSVSATRDERSPSSSATWSAHWSPVIWSICSHRQAAVEQPIKMHRTSRHHRRQPIRSRHEKPEKSKCCTRDVWPLHLLLEEAQPRPRAAAAPVSGPPQVQKD